MADRRRIVTIAWDGTVNVVRDIEDAAVFFAVKDSFAVTPGPRKTVMADSTRRYGGARPAAETHDNGTIAWKILVVGSTPDNVLANVEAILGNLETATQRLWLEWRPDGASNSTYYEMRGPAKWTPTYSWAQFAGAKSMYVDVEIPVAPLAWGDKQTITLPLYINKVTNGSVETDLSGWTLGSGTVTDPSSISGVVGWWKADSLSLTDGAAVSSWADSSVTGAAVTQATGANQPIYRAAPTGFNSKPAVYFDGINDVLATTNGALNNPSAFTILAVLQSDTSPPDGMAVMWGQVGATGKRRALYSSATRTANFSGNNSNVIATVSDASPVIATIDRNSGSGLITVYGNGTSNATGTPTLNAYTYGGFSLGANYDATEPFKGWVAEVIIVNRQITTAERQRIEAYLSAKYAIASLSPPAGENTLTQDSSWAAAGTKSARLQVVPGYTGVTVDTPSFAVTAGASVSGSLGVHATTISGGNVPIKVHWSDGTDSTAIATISGTGTTTPTFTLTAPGGVTSGKIRLAPSAAGTYDLAVDAVIVVDGTAVPTTYTDTGVYPPGTVQIPTAIPGDAPALVDLSLTNPTGGSNAPIWALVGWTQRPGSPLSGSVAPFGVIEAETGGSLSGFAVSSDANYLSGSGLKVTASGAGSASALYTIDPSVMQPDDFTPDELDIEVWARLSLDSTLVGLTVALSLLPIAGSTFGGEQFASEYGSSGKTITLPTSGTAKFRFVRLGTLSLPVDTVRPLKWNIKIAAAWLAGSTGTLGLDYLIPVPARQRAVSPSGKANDSGYGKFIGSTGAATKTIRSDLSGLVASGSGNPGRDSGLGGSPLELPPGNVDMLLKLSNLVADDPTSDATSEQLSWSGVTGSLIVTPRYWLARGA